jgi:hypothetical protein
MLIVSWSFGKLVIYKDETAAFLGTGVLEDIQQEGMLLTRWLLQTNPHYVKCMIAFTMTGSLTLEPY